MTLIRTFVFDDIDRFLTDECDVGGPTLGHENASVIYERYREWAIRNNRQIIATLTAFGKCMGQKFKRASFRGTTHYVAVRLKTRGSLLSDGGTSPRQVKAL